MSEERFWWRARGWKGERGLEDVAAGAVAAGSVGIFSPVNLGRVRIAILWHDDGSSDCFIAISDNCAEALQGR